MSPPLPLPSITLPPSTTSHLRALIYASSPGRLITPISLTPGPHHTVILSQTSTTVPLYHPPTPNRPSPPIFLSTFPLSAEVSLITHTVLFTTYLPTLSCEFSPPVETPRAAVADSSLSVLLATGTSSRKFGLLSMVAGKYSPDARDGVIVGAWGAGHPVFETAGLLLLARHLYRRYNRRIGRSTTVRKHVALLNFQNGVITSKRGWITVDKVRKWVCRVPLRGGTGEFEMCEDRHRESSQRRERVPQEVRVSDVARQTSQARRRERRDNEAVAVEETIEEFEEVQAEVDAEVEADVEEEVEEVEELMVAKMREFQFGDAGEASVPAPEERFTDAGTEVGIEGERDSIQLPTVPLVLDADLETLPNESCTTESSSDGENEETMLEALCHQYLNHGWAEGVQRELARQDTSAA